MESLDPRVGRLPDEAAALIRPKVPLDQLGSFEVFVEPKQGKPFQHEGIVHAPDIALAFVLAKEAFTRRFTCTAMCVAETRHVFVSPYTDGSTNAYDLIPAAAAATPAELWEVCHLLRRGKQHVHAGTVQAGTPEEAMAAARSAFGAQVVFNVWVVRRSQMRFTHPEELDLWNTLPDKKFRDAAHYKGGDKLKEFLERKSS